MEEVYKIYIMKINKYYIVEYNTQNILLCVLYFQYKKVFSSKCR